MGEGESESKRVGRQGNRGRKMGKNYGEGNIRKGKEVCGMEDKKEGKGVNDPKHLLTSSKSVYVPIYAQFVSLENSISNLWCIVLKNR